VAAAQPAAQPAPATAGSLCVTIAGLPVYAGAACIDYDADEDDGVIKHENTYATGTSADEVRRFYEAAFAQHGWAVTEFQHDAEDVSWKYDIAQAQRRLKVEVEPKVMPQGLMTRIVIAEK
jgi:hypothetical protein